jgi:methylmalonyl-CoA/ethylmalonyl-CoA epimerase
MSGWQEYPPLVDYTDLDVPDNDAFFAMKYKYTDAPGPQLQLCEPNDGPSPQRKFLDRTGGNASTSALSWTTSMTRPNRLTRHGDLGVRPSREPNRVRLRTPEIAGVTLEVRQSPTW